MTEAEWLACEEPEPMLEFVRGKVSRRKLRLFAVACCRRVSHLLADARLQQALDAAEQFADGVIAKKRLSLAGQAAEAAGGVGIEWLMMPHGRAAMGVRYAVSTSREGLRDAVGAAEHVSLAIGERARRSRTHCALLHDIFGNPFRPVAFDPAWRTETTVALVRQIYESRDFGAMPILADALQEAGCDSADVLDHCRGTGPHVRGCWVVDLVLEKQ